MQAHTVDPIHDSTNSDHSCISKIPVSSSLSQRSVLATVAALAATIQNSFGGQTNTSSVIDACKKAVLTSPSVMPPIS